MCDPLLCTLCALRQAADPLVTEQQALDLFGLQQCECFLVKEGRLPGVHALQPVPCLCISQRCWRRGVQLQYAAQRLQSLWSEPLPLD